MAGNIQDEVDTGESSTEEVTKEDLKHLTAHDLAEEKTTCGQSYMQFMDEYIGRHLNRGQVRRLAQKLVPEDSACQQILDNMKSNDKVALYIDEIVNNWLDSREPKPTWAEFVERLEKQHDMYSEYLTHLRISLIEKNIENRPMDDSRLVSQLVTDHEDFPVCEKKEAIKFAIQVLDFKPNRARVAVDNTEVDSSDASYYGSRLLEYWKQRLIDDTALHMIESLELIKFNQSHIEKFTEFLLKEPAFKKLMQYRKEESPSLR